jgi:hypothetical protein
MSHSSRSWHHPCGREAIRKSTLAKLSHPTSISSSEKEVSHGHEEGEKEEDVEVTSPARASYWGRALASYFAWHLSLMTAVGLKAGRCCFSQRSTGSVRHAFISAAL